MQIIIQGTVAVGNTPDGGRVLQVTDAQGNIVAIPLSVEAARSVGAALSTSLIVASGGALPVMPQLQH